MYCSSSSGISSGSGTLSRKSPDRKLIRHVFVALMMETCGGSSLSRSRIFTFHFAFLSFLESESSAGIDLLSIQCQQVFIPPAPKNMSCFLKCQYRTRSFRPQAYPGSRREQRAECARAAGWGPAVRRRNRHFNRLHEIIDLGDPRASLNIIFTLAVHFTRRCKLKILIDCRHDGGWWYRLG